MVAANFKALKRLESTVYPTQRLPSRGPQITEQPYRFT